MEASSKCSRLLMPGLASTATTVLPSAAIATHESSLALIVTEKAPAAAGASALIGFASRMADGGCCAGAFCPGGDWDVAADCPLSFELGAAAADDDGDLGLGLGGGVNRVFLTCPRYNYNVTPLMKTLPI